MRIFIAICAALIVGVVLVVGRTGAAPASGGYEAAVDEFWKQWETQQPSQAIRQAAPTPEYQTAWARLGRAADEYQGRFGGGKCLGHSLITAKPVSDRMQCLSFYALYEPVPLRVQMLYYRAKDTWSPIGLHIDAVPSRWLQEANPVQVVGAPAADNQQGAGDGGALDLGAGQ